MTLEGEIFILIKTLLTYGVNIFVLITGYYMCDNVQISVRKPIKLLFDVSFYGLCMYILSLFLELNTFSVTGLAKSVLPMLAGYRWFIKAYIVLYFSIPFLGRLMKCLNSKQHFVMIIVFGVFFSVWPAYFPNPPLDDYGYSFNNFFFLYMIAAYLRKYVKYVNVKKCCWAFGISFLATCLIKNLQMLGKSSAYISELLAYGWAHNSPFIIIPCCCILLLFVQKTFYVKGINVLASGAFAVYLIHGDFNTMQYMFNSVFKADKFQEGLVWMPHMVLTVILVYIVCFAVDYVKQRTVDILINKLFDKTKFLNFRITS